ncbi:MAG TPA: GTP pyrophosphokinase [Alphaproteobacteria bacterium]|nr:GTP pyrophosphokinase [Alphaproteobacteria bacterium]
MAVPTVEQAIELSLEKHRGRVDKGGAPYVLHPLRVMVAMGSDEERRVAVLHDVVEDSDVTLADLRGRGYPEREVLALDALTRRAAEPYEAFIERVRANPLARTVKRADLEDNMDVRRLASVDEDARERLERYRRAWARLGA